MEFAIIPHARLSDLNEDLVRSVAAKSGGRVSSVKALLRLRLAERAKSGVRLTFAALLLFGEDPERWHPKCHAEFIRFRGTSRRPGRALNIIGRDRISAPLTELSKRVIEVVRPHIGQRQILQDFSFSERSEHPPFAWQEAVVNAIAHRDYALRGTPIEIHQYDDRIEVISPGGLVPPVTAEALRRGGGVHSIPAPRRNGYPQRNGGHRGSRPEGPSPTGEEGWKSLPVVRRRAFGARGLQSDRSRAAAEGFPDERRPAPDVGHRSAGRPPKGEAPGRNGLAASEGGAPCSPLPRGGR